MIDHVSIQCADPVASAAFYDAFLGPLGGQRVMEFGPVVGFGIPPMPDFWIGPQQTGEGFREVAPCLHRSRSGDGPGVF